MPDPMTNAEIQDVLSSIRRLVSEDNRHRSERARDQAGPTAEAGKLVLTEALRVPESEPELEAAEEPATTGAAPTTPEHATTDRAAADEEVMSEAVSGDGHFEAKGRIPAVAEVEAASGDDWEEVPDSVADDAGSTLEDTIAELEAAVAGIGGDFEPDGSEVARGRKVDAELEEAFEEGFAVDEAADDEANELAQAVTAGSIGKTRAADSAEEDTDSAADAGEIAEEEPEVAEAVAQAAVEVADEPSDGVDLAEAAPDEPAAGEVEQRSATEDDAHADERADGSSGDQAGDVIPSFVHSGAAWTRGTPSLSDNVQAAGSRRLTLTAADAVPSAPAPWEREDAPATEDVAATGPEEAPGLASALAGEFTDESEAVASEDDEPSLFGPGDDAVIDMDMLRDLVAEIIREELQGTLGERITRNVRMLVRREISRALETHKFE